MYIHNRKSTRTASNRNLTSYPGLHGLGDDLQTSLDKIKAALDLNPRNGYVKGSVARRRLEEAFESVPRCSADAVGKRLLDGQTPLDKLFRHRLAGPTRLSMILILVRKAVECRNQLAAQLRRREEEERRQKRQVCEFLEKQRRLTRDACNQLGQNSNECRALRAEMDEAVEEFRRAGITCP